MKVSFPNREIEFKYINVWYHSLVIALVWVAISQGVALFMSSMRSMMDLMIDWLPGLRPRRAGYASFIEDIGRRYRVYRRVKKIHEGKTVQDMNADRSLSLSNAYACGSWWWTYYTKRLVFLDIERGITVLYTQRQGFQGPWHLALSLGAKLRDGCEIPSTPDKNYYNTRDIPTK